MSLLKELEAEVDGIGKFVAGAFVGLFKAEVTQVVQTATQILPTLETDVVTAAATGKLSSLGPVLGTLATQTATELEAQGVIVGVQALGTSVAAVLAAHPAVVAMVPPAATPVAAVEPIAATEPVAE